MDKDKYKTTVIFDKDGYSDDLGDGPSDNAIIVPDFLPPPHQLVIKEETQKVTLALSKQSIDFFKDVAKKAGVPYQRMIRALVDEYAEKHR